MNPLTIQPGTAHQLLQAMLIGWAALEIVLRLRNLGGRTTFDWTFGLVIVAVAAGVNLGFRAAHMPATVLGGGWVPVAIGLTVLAAGVALRTWAIVTLGRLFKFVVVIQEGHRVVAAGPYRLLRHPSYTGGLLICAGFGLASANWVGLAGLTLLPLAVILWRIHIEENALLATLGDRYRRYAAHHKRLVPLVW
jgi:protein-S-isoprenylcysteine O-methyltransferase Ste14